MPTIFPINWYQWQKCSHFCGYWVFLPFWIIGLCWIPWIHRVICWGWYVERSSREEVKWYRRYNTGRSFGWSLSASSGWRLPRTGRWWGYTKAEGCSFLARSVVKSCGKGALGLKDLGAGGWVEDESYRLDRLFVLLCHCLNCDYYYYKWHDLLHPTKEQKKNISSKNHVVCYEGSGTAASRTGPDRMGPFLFLKCR